MEVSGTYGPPRTQTEHLWEEIKEQRKLLKLAWFALRSSAHAEEQKKARQTIADYLREEHYGSLR